LFFLENIVNINIIFHDISQGNNPKFIKIKITHSKDEI